MKPTLADYKGYVISAQVAARESTGRIRAEYIKCMRYAQRRVAMIERRWGREAHRSK